MRTLLQPACPRRSRLRTSRSQTLGLLILLCLLAGCSAGRTSGTAQPPPPTAPGKLFPHASDAPGTRVGPTDPARSLTISLSLAGLSGDQIDGALRAINDPSSPDYHHYLTPDEYARRFGASSEARALVVATLRAAGLITAAETAGSALITAQGSVGSVEKLFGVQLSDYRTSDGVVYYAPDGAPHIPAALQKSVLSVLGLNNRPALHPAGIRRIAASQENTPPHMLGPQELERAYNFAPLHSAGLLGDGQTIALPEIDTFKQSDINAYDQAYGITAPQVSVVTVGKGSDRAQQVSETTLDIEVIHAIAPHAKIIVYQGTAEFSGLLQTFNQAVSDNKAKVMSVSLGGCEPAIWQAPDLGRNYFSSLLNIFRQAASQGMTVFVSSGDSGAYTCHENDPSDNTVSASLPATNPYVTAVGGTALFVNPSDFSYNREAGWEGPIQGSGGGGGLSVGYLRPDWQTGPGVSNQYSTDARQIPDVAAAADPLTGYRIYDSTIGCSGDDCWGAVGGTSASAPLWGGLALLANQQAGKQGKQTLGFINPALYAIGGNPATQSAFHDVTIGGNLYYPATAHWDFSTGWGTPDAEKLVTALIQAKANGQ